MTKISKIICATLQISHNIFNNYSVLHSFVKSIYWSRVTLLWYIIISFWDPGSTNEYIDLPLANILSMEHN